MMFRIAGALMILGIGLGSVAAREGAMSGEGREQPQTLTCAELGQNGYGNNAHVVVTDFVPVDFYVAEYREDNPSRYISTWFPLVPSDSRYAAEYARLIETYEENENADQEIDHLVRNVDFQVLFKSPRYMNDFAVDAFLWDPPSTVQGLVVNRIEELSASDRRLLRQNFPRADLSNVWIIHDNRKPLQANSVMLHWIGTILLIGAGAGLFVYRWRLDRAPNAAPATPRRGARQASGRPGAAGARAGARARAGASSRVSGATRQPGDRRAGGGAGAGSRRTQGAPRRVARPAEDEYEYYEEDEGEYYGEEEEYEYEEAPPPPPPQRAPSAARRPGQGTTRIQQAPPRHGTRPPSNRPPQRTVSGRRPARGPSSSSSKRRPPR